MQHTLKNLKHTRICTQCKKELNIILHYVHDDNTTCDACNRKKSLNMIHISRSDLEKLLYRYFNYGKQDMYEISMLKELQTELDEVFK